MTDDQNLSQQIINRMERIGNIGHWRWNVHENHLYWSKGIYEIHGLHFEHYTPSVEAAIDAYIPEDRHIVEEALSYAIEHMQGFKLEARIKRPSGEIRHLMSQGECEFNDTGEIIALFGVVQDVTAVKQQEELYQLSAMGSNAAIWDWDVAANKLRWAGRSAQVLGYPLNEHLPKSTEAFFNDLLHKDDHKLLKDTIVKHFTKLENFNIETRVMRQDGSYQWFLTRAQAQYNDDGKAIRVCGSMTSIQDLKEIQAKLESSNSDLENFACMAAHEIKSPIRSMGNYMELIKLSQDKIDKKLQDYIDQSIKIANQTSRMVDELLEYASLQDAQLNLSEVNIEKATKLIIRSMKEEVKSSHAKILLGDMPLMVCDETKIHTVITNLIQNALKYRSDKPPEISITLAEDKEMWQFSIKDNGRGMSEDNIKKAFTMFQRSDNVDSVKGTGIGLAICERIIDLHKGEIWAESELNKGSTFYFTVPKNIKKKK